jgi:hypothetical protein
MLEGGESVAWYTDASSSGIRVRIGMVMEFKYYP